MTTQRSLVILVAAPYRSGTADDPVKMRANLRVMEKAALALFRAGHVPLIGEWLALPLMDAAGSMHIGDRVWEEIQYPVAHRLIDRCDAVLRLEGKSAGADKDVQLATARGIPVYRRLADVPNACLRQVEQPPAAARA